jgi:hypothetical protein
MTSSLHLLTERASVRSYERIPSNPNSIVGELYFELGGLAFPAMRWTDRILTVIGSWIFPLRTLLLDQSQDAKLLFGEGSYGVLVRLTSPSVAELRFMRDAIEETDEVISVRIGVQDLLEELARTAANLQSIFEANGWDFDAQAGEFRRLRLLLAPNPPT